MELLFPFVESALPLAYGVLGVLLFHVSRSLPVSWFCFIFKVYSILHVYMYKMAILLGSLAKFFIYFLYIFFSSYRS